MYSNNSIDLLQLIVFDAKFNLFNLVSCNPTIDVLVFLKYSDLLNWSSTPKDGRSLVPTPRSDEYFLEFKPSVTNVSVRRKLFLLPTRYIISEDKLKSRKVATYLRFYEQNND